MGPQIAEPLRHGGIRIINVSGFRNVVILAATASQLLVQLSTPCQVNGTSLAWFNPASRSLTMALAAREGGTDDVVGVLPYNVQGKR
jgi:hypothetical protein